MGRLKIKYLIFSLIIILPMMLGGIGLSASADSPTPDIWGGNTDVATEFAGGAGTASNPYLISNGAELAYLKDIINGGITDSSDGVSFNSADKYYALTNDIYLNDTTDWEIWTAATAGLNEWTPIGAPPYYFNANFDGKNFAVFGIYIRPSGGNLGGLFDRLYGKVRNLGVKESWISAGNVAGGIAAMPVPGSVIDNCYNAGTIISSTFYAGGIGGDVRGCKIINCYNTGIINGNRTGGIVGSFDSNASNMVINCYNIGTVTGSAYAGGIAGYRSNGLIVNCYNSGAVTGSSYIGGILGGGGGVSNCYYSDASALPAIGQGSSASVYSFDADGVLDDYVTIGSYAATDDLLMALINWSKLNGYKEYLSWASAVNPDNELEWFHIFKPVPGFTHALEYTYGDRLDSINLNSSEMTVPGTLTFNTPSHEAAMGETSASVTFIPDVISVYYDEQSTISLPISVKKAILTVSVNNKSKNYNTANPAFDYTISGFVKGENASVIAGAFALSTPAVSYSEPGVYPINITTDTASSGNYEFNLSDGILTISKLVYNMNEVFFANYEVEYDGKAHSIEIWGRLPAGVTVTYTGGGVDAGKYLVTASFVGDSLYYEPIKDETRTLTIKKADRKSPVDLNDLGDDTVVTYYYDIYPKGDFTSTEKPNQLGTYYVKTVIEESANYNMFISEAVKFELTESDIIPEKNYWLYIAIAFGVLVILMPTFFTVISTKKKLAKAAKSENPNIIHY